MFVSCFLVQRFVWNEFSDKYVSTKEKRTYYPTVMADENIYELKVTDLPAIPYFPVNSLYEWTEYRFYGLRSATAYILVFDLSNVDTFTYIRTLRDQILDSRDDRSVPLLVVGNKQDLIVHGSSVVAVSTVSGVDKRRDIQSVVKKHWKCGYIECSARYNWRVVAVFNELVQTVENTYIEAIVSAPSYKHVYSPIMENIHEAFDRNKCVIL